MGANRAMTVSQALLKGADVDQSRKLAKPVTVE
jgi:glucosamine 6-phosphate synthetase-like amidotransferase/phosphosugar isomerase protein